MTKADAPPLSLDKVTLRLRNALERLEKRSSSLLSKAGNPINRAIEGGVNRSGHRISVREQEAVVITASEAIARVTAEIRSIVEAGEG